MKVVLLSDLHFKINQHVDIYIGDYEGIYYPMQNLLYAAEICKRENADQIFILGDVFDKSSNTHFLVDCIGRALELVSKICKVTILLGNHDMEFRSKNLKDYYSTLRLYKDLATIVEEPYVDHAEKFVMIPYHYYEVIYESFDPNWKDYILFTHIGINGFEYIKGIKSYREPINIEMLKPYSMVISGHYHIHSYKDNVYYLGSPWVVRTDEIGSEKFIHILDTSNLSIKKFKSIYSKLVEIPIEKIEDIKIGELNKLFSENKHLKVRLILRDPKLIGSVDAIVKEFGLSRIYYSVDENYVSTSGKHNINSNDTNPVELTVDKLLEDYLCQQEKDYVENVINEVNNFVEKSASEF